jgi:glutaredoxin-like YruB-family protein
MLENGTSILNHKISIFDMKKVIVYSTESCMFCVDAKEFLKKHKIPFKDINVNKDRKAAAEMIQKSGQTGVPVIDVDGEIITGFDVEKIKKALNLK